MKMNVESRWSEKLLALLLLVIFCALQLAATSAIAQDDESPQPYAFEITELNEGLGEAEMTPRLETPRAALESFLSAIDSNEPTSAAHVLNMNAIPAEEQADLAPELAMMLAYVIYRHDLISWRDVPDTPDARVLPNVQSSVAPYSRRSIELGEIMLDGRPVSISLHRYSVEGEDPQWLFSPTVVERIPRLYGAMSQGWLAEWVSLRQRIETVGRPSLWEWSIVGGVSLASAVAWLGVFAAARLVSRRLSRRWGRWFSATAVPLATLVAALIFRIGTVHMVVLTGPVASNLDAGSEIVLLAAGAWLSVRLLAALTLWLSETFVVPLASEDPENRRTKTNVYIVRRLGLVLVAILAIGYLLVRSGAFDTFGLSLLASAGVLGVLLAIAAQPLLGNMVAGLQIALSDPVRIGDVVIYDDHWGTVEDISFAHTVIRTAKETRLIVPHSEFLSRAFENWSKEGEPVRRIVKIAADYRIDVDLVRRKVGEIVQDDPRLAEPPLVEMVETDGDALVLWIWIMGTNAFTSWYLHNEVRENLIAFLRDHEEGIFLPRQRHLLFDKAASDFASPLPETGPKASPAENQGSGRIGERA